MGGMGRAGLAGVLVGLVLLAVRNVRFYSGDLYPTIREIKADAGQITVSC